MASELSKELQTSTGMSEHKLCENKSVFGRDISKFWAKLAVLLERFRVSSSQWTLTRS